MKLINFIINNINYSKSFYKFNKQLNTNHMNIVKNIILKWNENVVKNLDILYMDKYFPVIEGIDMKQFKINEEGKYSITKPDISQFIIQYLFKNKQKKYNSFRWNR